MKKVRSAIMGRFLSLFILFYFGPAFSISVRQHQTPVVVQLFNWTFEQIEKEIPTVAQIGYSHVHVSPPQLSIDRQEWWGRYQPVDYRVIDGPLGNEIQFKKMIDVAHSYGVKIVVDVVLNHMANADSMLFGVPYPYWGEEILEYPSQSIRNRYGLSVLFSSEHFNNTGCIWDWGNRNQVLYYRLCGGNDRGLPDLNLNHPHVLQMQRNYLVKLKNLGVDGFRFDAVKHMDETYFDKLFEGGIITSDMLVFGESIATQTSFKTDLEPYLRLTNMRFYDFPLLQRMNESLKFGDLRRLMNPVEEEAALADERAVTFVVNHDLPTNGTTFSFWLMPQAQEKMAFAYIFARPDGIPYVFSDLGVLSPPHSYLHRRGDIAAMIRFRQITHGRELVWTYADQNRLAWTRGTRALAVLNNTGFNFSTENMSVNLDDGNYYDLISAYENGGVSKVWMKVSQGKILEGRISPETAALFVKDALH